VPLAILAFQIIRRLPSVVCRPFPRSTTHKSLCYNPYDGRNCVCAQEVTNNP
jgi:hypothetical protein